jgi:hypothetical protein
MGNIRDPCSYYVSLWSFGVHGGGAFRRHFPQEKKNEFYNNANVSDVNVFYKWIDYLTKHSQFGTFTNRVAFKYGGGHIRDGAMKNLSKKQNEKDKLAAENVHPSNLDCWIHTENIMEDTKNCILQYANLVYDFDIDAKSLDVILNEAKEEKQNLSVHESCEFYWNKTKKDYIYKKDKTIIDALNLTCCGKSF